MHDSYVEYDWYWYDIMDYEHDVVSGLARALLYGLFGDWCTVCVCVFIGVSMVIWRRLVVLHPLHLNQNVLVYSFCLFFWIPFVFSCVIFSSILVCFPFPCCWSIFLTPSHLASRGLVLEPVIAITVWGQFEHNTRLTGFSANANPIFTLIYNCRAL